MTDIVTPAMESGGPAGEKEWDWRKGTGVIEKRPLVTFSEDLPPSYIQNKGPGTVEGPHKMPGSFEGHRF
jgi:hypothetical protein